ncbi:MAG TPA: YdcF family protein, partial [Azonexus sp.]|nr:YdcF family protein [Azonexus sp.]
PPHAEQSEAAVMADILAREFGVAVRWQEDESQDTAGNARQSAQLLNPDGVRRIVLVTQAFHMPRARLLFEAQGFTVIPAPAHFVARGGNDFELHSLLPSAAALHNSYYALHEWLGIGWAHLSGL